MSLINKMLKDLEKRQSNNRGYAPFPMSRYQGNFVSRSKFIFIGGVMITLIAALIWTFSYHAKAPFQPTKNELPITANNTSAVIDTPWVKDVTITEVQIHKENNLTQLTLKLDHAALYHLKSTAESKIVKLAIENAEIKSDLTALDYSNSALQNISSVVEGTELQLGFNLNPQAVLKDVNMMDEDKDPHLVLTFAEASPTEAVTGTIVKTVASQTVLADLYQKALSNVDQGNTKEAIDSLKNILAQNPAFKDARVTLAALYISLNKLPEADKLVQKGLNAEPDYIPLVELRARLLTAAGRMKEALAFLQTYKPAIEENPQFHAMMAALYSRTNENKLAVRIYKNLINLDPKNGSYWFGLGVALEKDGQKKNALEAYTHALAEGRLDSDSALYLQNRLQVMRGDVS